jgi:hypothetical protein
VSDRARRLDALRERLGEYFTGWEIDENPWGDPDGGNLRIAGALRDVLDHVDTAGVIMLMTALDVPDDKPAVPPPPG